MKIGRGLLVMAALTLGAAAPTWAVTISCSISLSADKTDVCVGEPVNITGIEVNCNQSTTTNFSLTYTNAGTYIVTNVCTACDSTTSAGYLTIHVSAVTNLVPSSATMCRGDYLVFTPAANPGTFPCEPVWGIFPTNAGTLSVDSQAATFALSATYAGTTATLFAVCGTTTNSATITVATNETLAITSQPAPQVVCVGQTATLSVAATGNSLSYQWRWNGMNLADNSHFRGSTNATLIISNIFATTSDCGTINSRKGYGYGNGSVVSNETYTYQVSGCIGFDSLGCSNDLCTTADPDGNIYLGSNCTTFAAEPTLASAGFAFPNRLAWSAIGYIVTTNTNFQIGKSGGFQALRSGTLYLMFNDSHYGDNVGFWDTCVNHTVEGVYDVIVTSDCGSMISTTATLSVSSVCDGIPDSWRAQYFPGVDPTGATTNSLSCASCDPDGDGVSNLQEFDRNTDPTNALSVNIVVYADSSVSNNVYDGYAAVIGNGHGPKRDIQAAITVAVSNDTLQVMSGTYTNTTFNLGGHHITVRASGPVTIR